MKLSHLLSEIDVLGVSGDISGNASDVCYDSRKCREGSLFVAIVGAELNGHDFVLDAIKRGAGYVVYDEENIFTTPGVVFIRVKTAVWRWADWGETFMAIPPAMSA